MSAINHALSPFGGMKLLLVALVSSAPSRRRGVERGRKGRGRKEGAENALYRFHLE
jgi:hypothetical protein